MRMSQQFVAKPGFGAICRRCKHDLEARKDGGVWCTNPACWHFEGEPHPTTPALNIPQGVES